MQSHTIRTEIKGPVMVLTIDRPEAMNALNTKVFDELDRIIKKLTRDDSVGVLIITGEGKAFVAGADIVELVDKNPEEAQAFSQRGQKTFANLEALDIPVIAAVNGYALGGGCELALACDIRLASNRARFGQPEVNLGLIPGYAATQRLSRLVGLSNALYLLYTAEMILAEEAFRMGLVQKVTEPDLLMEEAFHLACLIISKGPKAIRKVKKVTRYGWVHGMEAGSKMESEEFGSLFGNEGTEGMKAFLEKREPKWKT